MLGILKNSDFSYLVLVNSIEEGELFKVLDIVPGDDIDWIIYDRYFSFIYNDTKLPYITLKTVLIDTPKNEILKVVRDNLKEVAPKFHFRKTAIEFYKRIKRR